MKKFLAIIGLIGLLLSALVCSSFASTDPIYTDNLSLWKPDADNRTAALADANNNWEILDDFLGGTSASFFPYFYSVRSSAVSSGDTNDSFKIRMSTSADQPLGYIVRGADIEGRVENSGEATNVQGAIITANNYFEAVGIKNTRLKMVVNICLYFRCFTRFDINRQYKQYFIRTG